MVVHLRDHLAHHARLSVPTDDGPHPDGTHPVGIHPVGTHPVGIHPDCH